MPERSCQAPCRIMPVSVRPVHSHQEDFRFVPRQGLYRGSAFYPTQSSQCAIDRAISIKAGAAELLYVYIDGSPSASTAASTPWTSAISTA